LGVERGIRGGLTVILALVLATALTGHRASAEHRRHDSWNNVYWQAGVRWSMRSPAWTYRAYAGVPHSNLHAYRYVRYPAYSILEVPGVVFQEAASEPNATSDPATDTTSKLWFYCRDPAGYHPYVKQCNTTWQEVFPQSPDSISAPRPTR